DGVTTSMRLVCAAATTAAIARTATAIAVWFFSNRVLEVIRVSAAFVDVHRAAGTGSRPLFLIASTAAGDEKKATSARAAAGIFVPATIPAENVVTRCTSAGSAPTMSMPATGF